MDSVKAAEPNPNPTIMSFTSRDDITRNNSTAERIRTLERRVSELEQKNAALEKRINAGGVQVPRNLGGSLMDVEYHPVWDSN